MLSGLQKAKALKELKQLRLDKASQSGLALAKTLKRVRELRVDLGMGGQAVEVQPNQAQQSKVSIHIPFDVDNHTDQELNDLNDKAFDLLKSYAENGDTVFCKELNADVGFTKKAAKKYHHYKHPVKAAIAQKIKEVIADGKKFKPSEESYDDKEQRNSMIYHYLKTEVEVNSKSYGARIVIREDNNGNFHYDLQIKADIGNILDGLNTEQQKSDNAILVNSTSGNYRLEDNNSYFMLDSQAQLDKLDNAEIGMVSNLFVFDDNGNELKDELPIDTNSIQNPQSTELQTILDNLQSGATETIDLDFNHLAELASQSEDDETLTQIRNIINMELVSEFEQRIAEREGA